MGNRGHLIKFPAAGVQLLHLLSAVLLLGACTSNPSVDLVITNARIYTMSDPVWAEAAVVRGQRFVYVGDSGTALDHAGPDAINIDFEKRMVLPGLVDAHLHPIDGAIKSLFQCNFPFSSTPDDIQAAVARCVRANPDSEWIIGGQWDSDLFINHNVASPRTLLDAVSADKAVFLLADSGHDAWLNSKGLELAGIGRDSANPEGGTIVRAGDGLPNGVLLEKASYGARNILPPWTERQYLAGADELMDIANGYGVTAMKDASAEEEDVRALHQLQKLGRLNTHMASALTVHKDDWASGSFSTARMKSLRNRYSQGNLDANHVKIFLDGVPTSSRTAAMLDNYQPASASEPAHSGDLHYTPAQLTEMLGKLDRDGFTVKIHTAGDRSVRVALDAIAATRKANGDSGLRFELAHAGFISPLDIPRFRQLNVVADLSPYLWHPSPIIDSVIKAVGARGLRYWPNRALLDAGSPILAGSDWPAAVESMNPWLGMEALVSRADPSGKTAGKLWPEQSITLHEALRIFTLDGARAMRLEHQIGAIRPGLKADFIVLDQNLFEIPVEQIGATRVLATFFEGRLAYRAKSSPLNLPRE